MSVRLTMEGVTAGYPGGPDVLCDVNLELKPGLWAMIGPSGAGKTTLLRCLAGVLKPRRGRIRLDGQDVWHNSLAYRWQVGYAPQDVEELPPLTAGRYLEYLATLKCIRPEFRCSRAKELLDLLGLPDRRLDTYSGGMKRRFAVAAALLNDPDIFLLDDATAGLDPEEKGFLRNRLALLAAERIVLLATHLPEAVDGVADGWVLVRNKGVSLHGDPDRTSIEDLSRPDHCAG